MLKSLFIRETDGGLVITPPTCEVKRTKGGLQFRWKLPTGGKMSISEAPEEGKIDTAHFHKGLQEIYVVHFGCLKIFYINGNYYKLDILTPEKKQIFVAKPNVPHAVAQGSFAVFTVQTVGIPISNPERNNNDWYPATDEFSKKALNAFAQEK